MRDYYHTDDPRMVSWLADVMATARDQGRKVRLHTDGNGNLRVKVGEGMWTAPFASTPDTARD